jgi:hypothetical protein
MKKIIAAAALLIASVSNADAAVFDFSYTTLSGITTHGQVTATDLGGFFSVDDVTGNRNGAGITGYDFFDDTPQSFNYALGQVSDVDFSYYIGADNYEIRFPGNGNNFGTEFLLGAPGFDTSLLVTSFSLTPAAPAVPEPATWALMIVGFGGVGLGMRHRRNVAARVSSTA